MRITNNWYELFTFVSKPNFGMRVATLLMEWPLPSVYGPDSIACFSLSSFQCGFSRMVVQILEMHGKPNCLYGV